MAVICRARWRENRTIFNTPNPRLMNVSLLRDSKLLHGQERRGSRMSVRAPSRQPSMASLRPHSPNPSLGKTGLYSMPPSRWSAPPPISLWSGLPRLHFWFFFYHFNLPFLCWFLLFSSRQLAELSFTAKIHTNRTEWKPLKLTYSINQSVSQSANWPVSHQTIYVQNHPTKLNSLWLWIRLYNIETSD